MSGSTPFDLVVVAAGASRRMAGIDKLDVELGGQPLLARTIEAMAPAAGLRRTIVVAAPDRVADLQAQPWLLAVSAVVAGGDRRQVSVAAGIAALDELDATADQASADAARVVLIHDGARPLATSDLAVRVAAAAAIHGAAIPVLPVSETVKRIDGDLIAATVDRSDLATAQTPQGFRRDVLRAAYDRFAPAGPVEWTDEAALLESCTIPVHVVAGEPTNLKVTVPADLARAELLLPAAGGWRVGFGRDSHPFGPGSPLALGGILIDRAPRLHGHSDGDVALHAIADALLGAAALGDLGRHFPAGPRTPAGVASGELLKGVVVRLADAGWRPATIDLTILGARPRLGDRLEAMRVAIADGCAIAIEAVSVKAGTGNLSGDEGAGRAVSALAVATVVPLSSGA